MNSARIISVTILLTLNLFGSTVRVPGTASRPPSDAVDLEAMAAAPTQPSGNEVETPPHQPRDEDMVAEVTERFRLVGLELPPVMISFHTDREACDGHDGIYRGDNGQHRVSVCLPDRDVFAVQSHRRRTLAHELAHVWEQANLDDGGRTDLLASLDAKSWYGPDVDWEDRGAERFAETIVWGLYDQLRRPTLIEFSCSTLRRNFQLITGHDALGPLYISCAAP